MREAIVLEGTEVQADSHTVIKIPVSRLPSGTSIYLNAHVYHAKGAGPVMLLLAGVHGDEINGVEILKTVLNTGLLKKMEAGTVIVVPLLNIYGFINFSRDVPHGKDVNRSFPGSARGSLASRVAHTLYKKIIPLADFGIDYHTGGQSLYNYPQIRYTDGHEPSLELAQAFAAPCTIAARPIRKSLRKCTLNDGIPMLVFEGGESLRLDGFSIQQGIEGLQRILYLKKMIPTGTPKTDTMHFKKSTWQRAPRSGIFVWSKSSGNYVERGEPLGTIGDPYGIRAIRITAKRTGFLIGHNNAPVVNQGDALFHIAYQ